MWTRYEKVTLPIFYNILYSIMYLCTYIHSVESNHVMYEIMKNNQIVLS